MNSQCSNKKKTSSSLKEELERKYPAGTRICLIRMKGEPQMACGLRGEVQFVDDACQIHMKWKNGSSLALNIDLDTFEIIAA